MKVIDIFCASPASTAICLSLDQRSLIRQGSRILEQSRLLERQGSRDFEASNTTLEPGRKSKSERSRRSTDRRRSTSIASDNADQNSKEQQLEQKPRRSRHRSSVNSLSRFSCSAIDQSAIIPFKQPPASKPVKPPIFLTDPPTSSSSLSSSSGVTEVVVLKVSLHCPGCERKVKKHIAKMEGVTSWDIDLPKQKVIVIGNVIPEEVRESISRVKTAEFWPSTKNN